MYMMYGFVVCFIVSKHYTWHNSNSLEPIIDHNSHKLLLISLVTVTRVNDEERTIEWRQYIYKKLREMHIFKWNNVRKTCIWRQWWRRRGFCNMRLSIRYFQLCKQHTTLTLHCFNLWIHQNSTAYRVLRVHSHHNLYT